MEQIKKEIKCELYNDHMQNFKVYNIPKAQLIIADIPYNLGNNAYASSPEWYIDGDNKNGESNKANKAFFDTDHNFKIAEFMHFCQKMLKKEPKEKGKAPCMIIFCAFQQINTLIDYAKKYGFENYIPIFFIKQSSPQVLKANMKIVGATEYALIFYRDKLPKFNNNGKMIKNWFNWEKDSKEKVKKIHPTQKPVEQH
jgi:site-specific DNA-methyltransferase (adenine-specific)